jgi:hypothetical protein
MALVAATRPSVYLCMSARTGVGNATGRTIGAAGVLLVFTATPVLASGLAMGPTWAHVTSVESSALATLPLSICPQRLG